MVHAHQNGANRALSPDGKKIVTASDDGTAVVWELNFKEVPITPTVIDMETDLVFGETQFGFLQNGRWIVRDSIFPETIRGIASVGNADERIAVGDNSGIYVGTRLSPEEPDIPQQSDGIAEPDTGSSDGIGDPDIDNPGQFEQIKEQSVFNQQVTIDTSLFNQDSLLGSAGDFSWYLMDEADSEFALRAVHISGDVGVAVGDGGFIKVTFDRGDTWQSRHVGGDHIPDLHDVRVSIIDDNIHAVAVGTPGTDSGPSHSVLYYTSNLLAAVGEGENGISDWQTLPWTMGTPKIAYAALLLSLASLFGTFYFIRLWWVDYRTDKNRPVAAVTTDKVVGWEDPDVLGLKQIALQISMFLRNANTEPPLVIGIEGGWGSGKSSLMNLLSQDLKKRGTSVVEFNAWHHQEEDHLLAALFEAVRTQALPPFWSFRGP